MAEIDDLYSKAIRKARDAFFKVFDNYDPNIEVDIIVRVWDSSLEVVLKEIIDKDFSMNGKSQQDAYDS